MKLAATYVALCITLMGCAASPGSTPLSPQELAAFRGVVEALAAPAMQGRGLGTDGLVIAREELAQRFGRMGLVPGLLRGGEASYIQPFVAEHAGRPHPTHNVVAIIPGRGGLAGESIVIGAHYDHLGRGQGMSRDAPGGGVFHPGANDNASGVAAMLLIATWLTESTDGDATGDSAPRPRRAVIFAAFSAEETGQEGSRYFIDHLDQLTVGGGEIVAMINLDMIGGYRGGPLYAWGAGTSEAWPGWIRRAARLEGVRVAIEPAPGPASDHLSFHRASIPAVLLITPVDGRYHTPADTPDHLDYPGAVRVARCAMRVLHDALLDPEPIRWADPPEDGGD